MQPLKLERVGVIGAGLMGAGIADAHARRGFPVMMIDSAPGALDFKSVNFGRITATRDTPNDPRQIQFGLKFYW